LIANNAKMTYKSSKGLWHYYSRQVKPKNWNAFMKKNGACFSSILSEFWTSLAGAG
jgi:hypothetical protein